MLISNNRHINWHTYVYVKYVLSTIVIKHQEMLLENVSK